MDYDLIPSLHHFGARDFVLWILYIRERDCNGLLALGYSIIERNFVKKSCVIFVECSHT